MENRMLRVPAVEARTGLSRVTIWRRVRAGSFPAPVELGVNSIGWPEQSITDWLESQPRRTYGAEAPHTAEAKANTPDAGQAVP